MNPSLELVEVRPWRNRPRQFQPKSEMLIKYESLNKHSLYLKYLSIFESFRRVYNIDYLYWSVLIAPETEFLHPKA